MDRGTGVLIKNEFGFWLWDDSSMVKLPWGELVRYCLRGRESREDSEADLHFFLGMGIFTIRITSISTTTFSQYNNLYQDCHCSVFHFLKNLLLLEVVSFCPVHCFNLPLEWQKSSLLGETHHSPFGFASRAMKTVASQNCCLQSSEHKPKLNSKLRDCGWRDLVNLCLDAEHGINLGFATWCAVN